MQNEWGKRGGERGGTKTKILEITGDFRLRAGKNLMLKRSEKKKPGWEALVENNPERLVTRKNSMESKKNERAGKN